MENIRIAVLDQNDTVLTFFDNSTNSSPRYFEDELHEYLQGAASTFSFSVLSDNDDANHLVVGHKIAFTYDNRDFYLNIMSTERDETIVIVEAYSLSFELLNETVDAYTAPSAKTFSQYLSIFDPEGTLVVGTNEVSDKSLTCEWTEETTILNRLFSLANKFSSEIEFVTCLNDDHSLKQITINAYKEHSDSYQGIGKDRRDLVLRYGQNISGIQKKSDVTDLYTCIKLTGKDGMTISSLDKTEYDSFGNIEYRSPKNDSYVRAVQARDRFPSNLMNKNDRYIARYGTYETDNVNVLYGQALALLKKNCTPLVEYEVDGYIDTGIGDTVSIEDSEYKPTLYLEARVSEQIRSFTVPSKNKTTFSNFVEKQSEISPELLSRMQAMIDAKKSYTCSIITDNGIVFKNGAGNTTLTASMMDVGNDVTDNFTITWYKDGVSAGTVKTLTVQASDIVEKAVYKFEASDSDGIIHGFYEVTVSNVEDGTQGIPGAVGEDGKTSYIHIAYANDETGTIGFSLTDSSGKLYIGQYTDFTQPDSSNPAKYKWTKVKGDDGDPGENGQGTESITKEYYRSTSSTAPVGGSWSNTPPTWVTGSHLWERWKTVYKNPSETEYSTAVLNADWGDANSKITDVQQTLTDEGIVTLISESLANGQEISTTKFIMSALGLLIKKDGLTIQNNAGEVVLSADNSGNLTLTGNLNMLGAQSMAIRDNASVQIGSINFRDTLINGTNYESVAVRSNEHLYLSAGDATSTDTVFATGYAGGGAMIGWGKYANGHSYAGIGGVDTSSPTISGVEVNTANDPQVSILGCTKKAPLTLKSGFSFASGTINNVVYNTAGDFCLLTFGVTGNVSGGTHTAILNLPLAYRPVADVYAPGVGGTFGWFQIRIGTNGDVVVWHPTGMTSMRGSVIFYIN